MGVITVDTRDRKPIYEQLVDNIKQLVLRGVLKPDEQLPSVRTLAGELAINPNTIQKAYTELERAGIICSMQGRGSFVSGNVSELAKIQKDKAAAELRACLESARESGISQEEILSMVRVIWEEQA
ncbi:MAG: GntR family transcriptional regulator [Clostridia bacterium]|nr:GntR family transcriptional regulator [Clostridia bacterium]